jgi:hypothetical protein
MGHDVSLSLLGAIAPRREAADRRWVGSPDEN